MSEPIPIPEPILEPIPEPTPEPIPIPKPIPDPIPEQIPEPIPVPIPESIPETDSEPTIRDRYQKTLELVGIDSVEISIFPITSSSNMISRQPICES